MKPLDKVDFITVIILGSFGLFSLICFIEKPSHWHLLAIFFMCLSLVVTIYKSSK